MRNNLVNMTNIFFEVEGDYVERTNEIKREIMSRVFREQCVREHKERKASLQSWLTPLNENWD